MYSLGVHFGIFFRVDLGVFFGIDFDAFVEMGVICIYVESIFIWTFGSDLDVFVAIDFDVFPRIAAVSQPCIYASPFPRQTLIGWERRALGLRATAFDSSQAPSPAARRVYRVIRYRAIFAEVCGPVAAQ